jgi:hypothetical protein
MFCRPFDNTQITKLTEALAATMTTITAADINTLSAVQTVSPTVCVCVCVCTGKLQSQRSLFMADSHCCTHILTDTMTCMPSLNDCPWCTQPW